ncbi:unnamed protein product, partial [Symbiodinium sp. CCMP2456]
VEGSARFGNISTSLGNYQVHRRVYEASVNMPGDAEVQLRVDAKLDEAHIRVEPSGQWCDTSGVQCRKVSVEPVDKTSFALHEDVLADRDGGTYSLVLSLRPRQNLSGPSIQNCSYTFQVHMLNRQVRLAQLGQKIAELRATVNAMEDFNLGGDAAGVLKRYHQVVQERNMLLKHAYDEETAVQGRLVTFLAVGLTGTGKSELCYWMTGDKEKCSPSATMKSHTSKVAFVKAHPFADAKLLSDLEWIDTPGRGDTRGEEEDAKMWSQTVDDILEKNKNQKIDRIVWVLNAAWQRGVAMRELMIKELRRSFGIHLYKHLDLVFNFLPHVANQSEYLEQVLLPQRQKFLDWIMEQEMNLFSWPAISKDRIQREINETGFYGINIHPKFLAELPDHLPLSAPYLQQFPPFSYPAGVDELIRMYDTAAKDGGDGLFLDNKHPRVGLGVLEKATLQSLDCGLRPRGKQLVPGVVAVSIHVEGSDFLPDDRVALFPSATACGSTSVSNWPDVLAGVGRPIQQDRTTAFYRVNWQPGHEQLCFCEAPACNESWRFGQSKPGVQIRPSEIKCKEPSPTRKIKITQLAGNAGAKYGGCAVVGDLLIATPGSAAGILLLNTSSGRLKELRSGLGNFSGDKWKGTATDGHKVYASPDRAMAVLVFDVAARTIHTISLDRVARQGDTFGSIAVGDGMLFMTPGHGQQHLVTMDLVGQNVSFVDLSTYAEGRRKQSDPRRYYVKSGEWNWLGCIVEKGQLFLTPHRSPQLIVMHTRKLNITALDTSELAENDADKQALWSGSVHYRGRLYAAPHDAERTGRANVAHKYT